MSHNIKENAFSDSPWMRCGKCNGLTHRNVLETTPTRRECCACCGSYAVTPANLRAEYAERRRLLGGAS